MANHPITVPLRRLRTSVLALGGQADHAQRLVFGTKHEGKFLETKTESVKVVFSTYQSAWVVSEGMAESETFELCIFDEAHKTAGREGVYFGFALKDENLTISKRLFLTATPRHYDINLNHA